VKEADVTIEDPSTIDGMGIRREDGRLELSIYDHLGWEDEAAHLTALSDKVNGYLVFLTSGQAAERYPGHDVSSPWLRVVAQQTPPESAMQAFEQIAGILAVSGVNLTLEAGEGDQRRTFVFS
jgi:hypothetical protein